MSPGSSEELIRELARDLEPVRPIPRLRTVVAGLVGLWLGVAALGWIALGARPDVAANLLPSAGVAAVFVALALAGLAGLVAALAMSVPGREADARRGLLGAILGMGVAAGIGTLLFLRSAAALVPASGQADLTCLAVAIGVSLLPAVGVVGFAGRAVPFRPLVLVIAGAAAAAALGAVSTQASCVYKDPRHLMLGHVIAPAVGALVLSLPLLLALRRVSRDPGGAR